ncbi:MAG: thiamine-phosphate kinase [Pseudomonadota bacterium]
MDEFSFIARYLRPLACDFAGAQALQDDVAILPNPPTGQHYVLSTDTIVEDVHLLRRFGPAAFAWRGLGCAVSDIIAKGATPICYFLNLSLPAELDESWLANFTTALGEAQNAYGVQLAGGDCTAARQIVMSYTIVGVCDSALLPARNHAQAEQGIFVTGTIGDGYLGLQTLLGTQEIKSLDDKQKAFVKNRYLRPTLRLQAQEIIKKFATSAMDISDGFVQDCEVLAQASGLKIMVNLANLPLSDAATIYANGNLERIFSLIRAGDDYEILFTAQMKQWHSMCDCAARLQLPLCHVGVMCDASRHRYCYSGHEVFPSKRGYRHFAKRIQSKLVE